MAVTGRFEKAATVVARLDRATQYAGKSMMKNRRLGVLDTPLSRGTTIRVVATLAAIALASPALAGTWKHEYVANDGNILTYTENGKTVFYIGCGRGFAIHVKYPGQAKKEGDADIAISTSRGRMAFNGEFEDPEEFKGTDFRQTYLGYSRRDDEVFGKKWNAKKARVLDILDSHGPITISGGDNSYRLPAIDAGSNWHKAIEECKF
jgi:hypothetical protein